MMKNLVLRPGAVRRHCEPRQAFQAQFPRPNLTYRRILRQPWIASPRFNVTYRKCGGGFAMTGEGRGLRYLELP
ncbi:MAG: hypothetical protein LBM98_02215 [Oscillospiraceae bacterium]|nr:hypothetical protein [Oscillospiraceae bacterium]